MGHTMLTSDHWSSDTVVLPDEDFDEFELFVNSLSIASTVTLTNDQCFAVGKLANKYGVPQLKDGGESQSTTSTLEQNLASDAPASLHFALKHNLFKRAAYIIDHTPLDHKHMPMLHLLTLQDSSEGGEQRRLLQGFWPKLCQFTRLQNLPFPSSYIRAGCMWPFLTARLWVPPSTNCFGRAIPAWKLEHEKKKRWLAELSPARWLAPDGEPDLAERQAAYQSLLKCMWRELCKDASVPVGAAPDMSSAEFRSTWPFISQAVLNSSFKDKYEGALHDVNSVLEKIKRWPSEMQRTLPSYPKRATGAPSEEAKNLIECRIGECGIDRVAQGIPLPPDSDSDSDSD